MRELGENLSPFPNVDFLESSDANELKRQLMQIRFSYRLLGIYALGGRHYAWLATERPIIKKTGKIKEN